MVESLNSLKWIESSGYLTIQLINYLIRLKRRAALQGPQGRSFTTLFRWGYIQLLTGINGCFGSEFIVPAQLV
jgi:hypothetical protein